MIRRERGATTPWPTSGDGWHCHPLIDTHPRAELYWFLLSKGYKTYRYLPLFFHEFHPSPIASHPGKPRTCWTHSPRRTPFGHDPVAGVVRGPEQKDRLRPGIADVTGMV